MWCFLSLVPLASSLPLWDGQSERWKRKFLVYHPVHGPKSRISLMLKREQPITDQRGQSLIVGPHPRPILCRSSVLDPMTEQRSALTELLQRPRVPADWGQEYTLWIHEDSISRWELILNPDLFPDAQVGRFVALHNPATLEGVVVRITSLEGSKIFRQRSFQVPWPQLVGRSVILTIGLSSCPCTVPLPRDSTFMLGGRSMCGCWSRSRSRSSSTSRSSFVTNTLGDCPCAHCANAYLTRASIPASGWRWNPPASGHA